MKRIVYSLGLVIVFVAIAAGSGFLAYMSKAKLDTIAQKHSEIEAERDSLVSPNGTDPAVSVDPGAVKAWRDHYRSVTLQFQSNLAQALRDSGGAITESTQPRTQTRELESLRATYSVFDQTFVGDISSVLNVLGTLERNDPLLKVERLRLSRGGENVVCSLKVAIPKIDVEGVAGS